MNRRQITSAVAAVLVAISLTGCQQFAPRPKPVVPTTTPVVTTAPQTPVTTTNPAKPTDPPVTTTNPAATTSAPVTTNSEAPTEETEL